MKIGFYSCMNGMPWGGSEELWYRSARRILDQGHQVAVNYRWWPKVCFQLQQLREMGAQVALRDPPPKFWHKKIHEMRQLMSRRSLVGRGHPEDGKRWLNTERPDAVLITIGYHPDPIFVAGHCQDLGIPYAINVQSASNSFFIHGDRIEDYRKWYAGAWRVFFVSPENQHKVETNLAATLSNSEIVANPYNVRTDIETEWPEEDALRLACVGRIHFQSKGQDILVDVMRQPKWRSRKLSIHFYGHDQGNRRQLEELIRLHGLDNQLKIEGYVGDVKKIWNENHGLILPSRYEGAPLVVIEAMFCHRLVITTDIGRNRELIDEGESGFVAPCATTQLLDAVMENAWAARQRWREMGRTAGVHVRQRFSLDPAGEFAARILQLGTTKGVSQ